MKFFTRELYSSFQRDDLTRENMKADMDDWENRLDAYQKHLDSLNMPPDVKKLAELPLHDAKFIRLEIHQTADSLRAILIVIDDSPDRSVCCINYELSEMPLVDLLKEPSPGFALVGEHDDRYWLYEEVDACDDGWEHQILMTDGSITTFRFKSVHVVYDPKT